MTSPTNQTKALRKRAGYEARLAESEELAIERENRATRSDTRARLLVAALDLFSKNGFEASTMRDLAQFAGIKAPAIYNHFKSKEALLGEALLWAMEDFNERVLGPRDERESNLEALEGILERHIRYQLDNPVIARAFDILMAHNLLQRVGEITFQQAIQDRLRLYLRELTKLVSQLVEESPVKTDYRIVSSAVSTMYDQVGRWYVSTSKAADDHLVASYWELTRRMLGIDGALSAA
ncbi:TetR/AcrR family transcriptional regulator [Sphingomonadales bacterium 56]|uniref:TetR/AcrR family transcriptional regulator n=1 Tax=unclassified Sphingobium TaxID=2611147 RepID=UPI0019183AF3|nr:MULTISPECIES: TetR/AcrR family transcriptional regulator [unclassified Sphingobium]MBY2929985.1 TetR/AcrR family transcriptional regulator [Sphingomonadales bacterium 56]MBY2959766.1 TetR/AcrR family transcriptional regulator [Sphingomonadales bacterium 58]CAD7339769.1 Nucleoid occlusion factor SlmA [Sphingobium sp. S8]CAD7340537.1 Nucleoid occlusion factor SlmA [Sphingobium sp. S6]